MCTGWKENMLCWEGDTRNGKMYLHAIESGAGTYSGKPRKKVVVADSGEIPKHKWDEER